MSGDAARAKRHTVHRHDLQVRKTSVPQGCVFCLANQDKELKGLGPATASAILSTIHPQVPFMSDEAMMQLGILKDQIKYDMTGYRDFVAKLRDNQVVKRETAVQAEQRLWSRCILDAENLKADHDVSIKE